MVNMAANHTLITEFSSLIGHGNFKIRNEVNCFFHLELQVRRERPVRQAQPGSELIEISIQLESELVQTVTHIGQPFGTLNHPIKIVAMDHPEFAAIGGHMHGLFSDFNTAE